SDLLLNGVPATGLTANGSNYTFSFIQPSSGLIAISWSTNHGIADLATAPNAFNATNPGATWSFTLDARTILIQSNATWAFLKGTAEASTPLSLWRTNEFDDSGWSNALAPFYYGDPYNTPGHPGTLLSDMQSNYTSIFLRGRFVIPNANSLTNLI